MNGLLLCWIIIFAFLGSICTYASNDYDFFLPKRTVTLGPGPEKIPPSTTQLQPPSSTRSTSQSSQSSHTTSSSSDISSTALSSITTATSTTDISTSNMDTSMPSTVSGNGDDSDTSPQLLSSYETNNVATIAGSVVAGAVGLLVLCGLALFYFRRRHSRSNFTDNIAPILDESPEPPSRVLGGPMADPLSREPTMMNRSLFSTSTTDVPRSSFRDVEVTTLGGRRPSVERSTLGQGSASQISIRNRVQNSPRILEPTPVSSATLLDEIASTSCDAGHSEGAVVGQSRNQPVVTGEQANFITSLYQNNVLTDIVTRVVEQILANPNLQGTRSSSAVAAHDRRLRSNVGNGQLAPPALHGRGRPLSDSGASQYGGGETRTAPPSYEHTQGQ